MIAQPQADVTLSAEQQSTLMKVLSSPEGTFHGLTGRAGAGKSTVLNHLRRSVQTIVVAPTGLAAINVGGQSIHSFFSLPIGPLTRSKVNGIGGSQWADAKKRAIENCDLIAIDERSMVRADLMDGINWCLQKTLRSNKPFGGKKILAIGDDYQLEPVVAGDGERDFIGHNYKSPFWFDAKAFNPDQDTLEETAAAQITQHNLREVFRQSDPEFIAALNQIRLGDTAGLEYLNQRVGIPPSPGSVALCYTNKTADHVNEARMEALACEARHFAATITGDFGKDMPAPQDLTLKVGAQVMVTRNIMTDVDGLIANGSVGVLVGFWRGQPIVELRDGRVIVMAQQTWEKIGYTFDAKENKLDSEVKGSFSQYPIKLAWAVTVHKSQGQTLDAAVLELDGRTFAHGQLYVGLSRVRGVDGLFLRRLLTEKDLVINPRVGEWMAAA